MAPSSDTHHNPRRPLSDQTAAKLNQANILPCSKTSQDGRQIAQLPHHESLHPNGMLGSSPPEVDDIQVDKHLEEPTLPQPNPKRLSDVSATSTNASVAPGVAKTRKRHIGPWNLGTTLGQGATGRVRKARHVMTGQVAAVKIMSRKVALELRSKSVAQMESVFKDRAPLPNRKRIPFGIDREIIVMKVIEHPNIVRCLDVWENRGEMYLVLEHVDGGELFEYIVKSGQLKELEAVRIFRQIISGLAHCHRFLLCHRDIKPENILLDSHMNVKIVDFGMAAMQPPNKVLDTSCGSPHYAAPEVATGYPYRGDKADVWSSGVVLYVMLAGSVPFGCHFDIADSEYGGDNLRRILEEVIYREVEFPDIISDEAAHLLSLMLQKDPTHRIEMIDIWKTPLLKRYEEYAKHSNYSHRWIGGPPPLLTAEECGPQPTSRAAVDMDLVDNLCTLWQINDVNSIIDAILHPETNYEQLLYQRLLRTRNEQEENFQGLGIGISASDYHHVRRGLKRATTRPVLKRSSTRASFAQKRQKSQFSIVENSRRPSIQLSRRAASEAGTEGSYDPFRASRNRIQSSQADFAKITIHRSPKHHGRFASTGVVHPAVARLQENDWTDSIASELPHDAAGNLRELRRRKAMRSQSRSSLASSALSVGSSSNFNKSKSYKRPVSFNHSRRQRRNETPPPRPRGPSPHDMQQKHKQDQLISQPSSVNMSRHTSKVASPPQLRSRKEGQTTPERRAVVKNKRMSALLNDEARQISMELEQYCDSAFKEPSPDKAASRGSPSKDIQHHVSQIPSRNLVTTYERSGEEKGDRPLPEPPMRESLASQELRELEFSRENLLQQSTKLPNGFLDNAIANLDRLIADKLRQIPENERKKRITSAPDAQTKVQQWLSPVKEEEDNRGNKGRHVSEPTKSKHTRYASRDWRKLDTIRVVNEQPAPQGSVVHKRSDSSLPGPQKTVNKRSSVENLFSLGLNKKKSTDTMLSKKKSSDTLGKYSFQKGSNSAPVTPVDETFNRGVLEPIDELVGQAKDKRSSKRSSGDSKDLKRKGWFRRSTGSQKSLPGEDVPIPPEKDTPWRKKTSAPPAQPLLRSHALAPLAPSIATRQPIQPYYGDEDFIFRPEPKEKAIKQNKFLQFFSKKKSTELSIVDCEFDEEDDDPFSQTSNSIPPRNGVRFNHPTGPKPVQQEPQNFLARFFRVKPAKRDMELQVNKFKAMKHIRSVFRDWKQYGMRDVVLDKEASKIFARVDATNTLKIKPVSVCVEFFSVAQRGRKSAFCMARITQEHGAKSSFERVYTTLMGILRGRDLVVRDKKVKQEMRQALAEWEAS